jgi:hypothetical protein
MLVLSFMNSYSSIDSLGANTPNGVLLMLKYLIIISMD